MFTEFREHIIRNCLNEDISLHHRSRVILMFNLAFSVTALGVLATIISLFLGTYPILIPALGNVGLGILALTFMRSGKFQLGAKIYFSALFFLLFGNLIFNAGTMHIGSPFWVMLLNIIIIYILGKKWGIMFLILSILGFSYYVIAVLPTTLEIINSLPVETYYSVVYETIFVLFLVGYVIITILNASKNSDRLLQQQYDELKLQNEHIFLQEGEKTVMLKEIHHRVKNNLQVIISLMRLQMREMDDNRSILKYKETINRVLTMAVIHEKLYQSESLSQINLEKYFYDLSNDLLYSFETDFKVELSYTFDLEKIDLKTIVPLALIFNELFSNSLKHAFDKVENPMITLSLVRSSENEFILKYEDNGTWKEPISTTSFGFELIESLSSQLDGEMLFLKSPHPAYEFKFKQMG